MSISIGTFWFIVAIIFGVGELMTTSLTLIWFSIGALLVMFLSIFIESILWQVIIFAVVSIILLVIATKYLVDRDKDVKYNTNLQGIISQKAIVTQTIEPYETGVAKLNGEEWTAMSKDETRIEAGKLVEVVAIEGVKLIVKEVREDRINYTFLTFLILFNTYYIMTNNIKGDILIQFNLGFVIFISIAILLLEAMDFSICKIAFQDILMMLGESKMGVYKVSKKSKVDLNLKKLSTIIILELLCCDLIGIYYINIKNVTNLSYMISYEILVIIIFTLVEMYQLSLIRSKVKYIKYKNKKLIKEKVDLGKVINLEQYR